MKNFATTVTLALVVASPAIAQAVVEDTDGDGAFSMEEMMATFADMTEDVFNEIDTNDDGVIDGEELAAAEAAGLIGG